MLSFGINNLGAFDVLVYTADTFKSKDLNEGFKLLLEHSPAMAIKLDMEKVRRTTSLTSISADDIVSRQFLENCVSERPLILFDAELQKYLTDAECRAILEHEISHIVHGDLDRQVSNSDDPFQDNLEMELAADARAAMLVGKTAMRTALHKTLTYMAHKIHVSEGAPMNEILEALHGNDSFKKRIAALS